MRKLVDKLSDAHTLTAEEYRSLLLCKDAVTNGYLQKKAQQTTIAHFGRFVFIRGLIEISNRCRNKLSVLRHTEKQYDGFPLLLVAGNHFVML